MRRRNEQAEQRFRLMGRMGVKKVCDESSDAAQKHDDASNSQFGADYGCRRQMHRGVINRSFHFESPGGRHHTPGCHLWPDGWTDGKFPFV